MGRMLRTQFTSGCPNGHDLEWRFFDPDEARREPLPDPLVAPELHLGRGAA
jgi:hypothetical protein